MSSGVWKNGIWDNNPLLIQFVGLCPLMAVSNSFVNSMMLAFSTIFVLVASAFLVSFIKEYIRAEIRLPIFVLLIASLTTIVELFLQYFTYELYLVIGLYIPLITTNCILLARMESFASRNKISTSMIDAIAMGIGFFWVLLFIGSVREILGSGTLFYGMSDVFSFWSESWVINLGEKSSIPLFAFAPGGFLTMGLVLATIQKIKITKANKIKNNESKTQTAY
jgi:electron transport complex protein RnfE